MVKELRRRLFYNPNSGVMVWIAHNKAHPRLTGQPAGCVRLGSGQQRVYIKINGKAHPRARLAFIWMTGRVPVIVDHKNGITMDDRWKNLREATVRQNNWNRGPVVKRKKSGLPLGVRSTKSGKFEARVAAHGFTHYLGQYDTPELAFFAYRKHKAKLHKEFKGRLYGSRR